jgi:hypothetical protein
MQPTTYPLPKSLNAVSLSPHLAPTRLLIDQGLAQAKKLLQDEVILKGTIESLFNPRRDAISPQDTYWHRFIRSLYAEIYCRQCGQPDFTIRAVLETFLPFVLKAKPEQELSDKVELYAAGLGRMYTEIANKSQPYAERLRQMAKQLDGSADYGKLLLQAVGLLDAGKAERQAFLADIDSRVAYYNANKAASVWCVNALLRVVTFDLSYFFPRA